MNTQKYLVCGALAILLMSILHAGEFGRPQGESAASIKVNEKNLAQHERDATSLGISTIFDAVKAGDLSTVDRWLNNDMPNLSRISLLRLKDRNGMTALMLAAQAGHLGIVERLLGYAVSYEEGLLDILKKSDPYGNTALTLAAGNGYFEIVGELLAKIAEVEKKKQVAKESSSLIWDIITHADNQGMTALMYAARAGNPNSIDSILAMADTYKIDSAALARFINAQDTNDQRTAIIWALTRPEDKKSEIIQAILKYPGANLDLIDKYGRTALFWARKLDLNDIVADFKSYSQKGSLALVSAPSSERAALRSSSSSMSSSSALAAQAAPVQISPQEMARLYALHQGDGRAAHRNSIMWAASSNDFSTVERWLNGSIRSRLSKEQLLMLQNEKGATALTWAAIEGRGEMVIILLNEARKVGLLSEVLQQQDDKGITALMWAASHEHLGVVEQLITALKGLDKTVAWRIITKADNENMSTLISACIAGNASIVRLILQAADRYKPNDNALIDFINTRDTSRQRTAVIWAIRFTEGATKKQKEQHSPAEVAAVVHEILKYPGVDLLLKDRKGKSVGFWAARLGLEEVVTRFIQYVGRDQGVAGLNALMVDIDQGVNQRRIDMSK